MSKIRQEPTPTAGSIRTALAFSTSGLLHLLTTLLPAVVSGIAFAWFCTMPPYAPPSLPDNWDPECAEWKPEWKSLPTPPNSTIYRVREPDGDRENELLLRISDTSQFQLQRVSMSSGEVLAESSLPGLPRGRIEVQLDSIRLHDNYPRGQMPAIIWLDRETLQLQRELHLHSTQWQISARDTLLLEALAELPDQGIAGMLDIRVHTGGARNAYWFRANHEGTITEVRQLAHPRLLYRVWPSEAPQWFLLQEQLNPSKMEAIDVATGAPVAHPEDLTESVKAAYTGYPSRHAPLPFGYGNAMDEERRIRGYWALMPEASHPLDFGRQPEEALLSRMQQVQMQLGYVRRSVWRARHGTAAVTERANDAYRLDALVCYHPESAANDRLLTGSVLDMARTQLHVSEIRLRQYSSDPNGIAELEPEAYIQSLEAGVSVTRLGDGHLLVEQGITGFPEALSDAPAICRFGLLRKGETSVVWLGWLPATMSPYGPSAPEVEIHGNVLLFSNSGLNRPANQNQPAVNRDFQWATLLLPPELADLPEGIVE